MDAMDVDTQAADVAPIKLEVLALVNDSRMTYGLRHQDYQRYREHCAHRVRRLRQILKLAKPNNKATNQTKELPATFSDARYLHLYIYEVERAWAYAMELKQELASSMDGRKRHHLRKRLKRASQQAETLYQLCEKQSVERRAAMDVKAYGATMKGYLLAEQQEWQAALNAFVISRVIYEWFASSTDDQQQETLSYSAIDEIDPHIRLCAYRLQLDTSNIPQLVDNLKKKTPGIETLEKELAQIAQQKNKERKKLVWRGMSFEVKNNALSQAIDNAKRQSTAAEAVAAWTEAEKMVKKALKENKEATTKVTSSKSAKSTEDLNGIHAFISYHLNAQSFKRNMETISQTKTTPQESVRLYDESLQMIASLRELLIPVEIEAAYEAELDVLEHYHRGYRCLYVAQVYADLNRNAEALALYQRAQSYIVQAKQQFQQISGFSEDALLTVSADDFNSLEQSVLNGSWKMQAAWHLAHGAEENDLSSKMEQLQLDATGEAYLIDHLDTYPASLTAPGSNVPNLVAFPPRFEPVVCKPFYFDLAANYVQYPDSLSLRVDDRSSGLFSKIFGFGKS
ncbi:hypothetical protein BX666DRAFT_1889090 [Dichotomocladium elegans]|nr:hypothetical protein BX666DRAFT_1889090 [Dichotomocladium elegans]